MASSNTNTAAAAASGSRKRQRDTDDDAVAAARAKFAEDCAKKTCQELHLTVCGTEWRVACFIEDFVSFDNPSYRSRIGLEPPTRCNIAHIALQAATDALYESLKTSIYDALKEDDDEHERKRLKQDEEDMMASASAARVAIDAAHAATIAANNAKQAADETVVVVGAKNAEQLVDERWDTAIENGEVIEIDSDSDSDIDIEVIVDSDDDDDMPKAPTKGKGKRRRVVDDDDQATGSGGMFEQITMPRTGPSKCTLQRAKEMAMDAFEKHGLRQAGWTFGFDSSVRRLGNTKYGRKFISISRHMVLASSDARVLNTILHEVAHALVGHTAAHGPVWKQKAIEIGCDGKTTDNGPRFAEGRYKFKCSGATCTNEWHFQRRCPRSTKMGLGKCKCGTCGAKIVAF